MSDALAHLFAEGLQPQKFALQEAHGPVMVTFARCQTMREELGRIIPEAAEFFGRMPRDGHFWTCCVSDGLELFASKIPGPVFAGEA
jgi:hypothetical protein